LGVSSLRGPIITRLPLLPKSSAPSSIPSTYKPHGRSDLQRLFHERFPAFKASYEEKYATDFGRFRLPLISGAAEAFNDCGDWENGIARIRFTVVCRVEWIVVPAIAGDGIRCAGCGYDYFRPFSCKSFFLCPECGGKMVAIAVIQDPAEIRGIIACLAGKGRRLSAVYSSPVQQSCLSGAVDSRIFKLC